MPNNFELLNSPCTRESSTPGVYSPGVREPWIQNCLKIQNNLLNMPNNFNMPNNLNMPNNFELLNSQ